MHFFYYDGESTTDWYLLHPSQCDIEIMICILVHVCLKYSDTEIGNYDPIGDMLVCTDKKKMVLRHRSRKQYHRS